MWLCRIKAVFYILSIQSDFILIEIKTNKKQKQKALNKKC